MKENRKFTVGYGAGYKRPEVPMIRMQGKWLEELEFGIGAHVNVECRKGQLIITKANEAAIEE